MKKLFPLLLKVMLLAALPTLFLRANPPANDPPVITVSGNTSICYGSSTTLTASGALTYSWTTALALDGVSSASLAVGLHKLKTSYTGFALQLRRQSDNAIMDFGFSGNDLDLVAINTFLNGANGFCSILYDQSGNGRHMVQPSNASQPLFIASGQNGKPVLRCNTSQYMTNTTNFTFPYSVVYAAKQTGPTRHRVLSSVSNNWLLGWWNGAKDQAYFEGWLNASPGTPVADNNPAVYSATGNGNTSSVFKNGTALFTNNAGGMASPNGIQMNGSSIHGELSDCDFMDIMIFNAVLSNDNRSAIEYKTESYYNLGSGGSQLTVSPLTTTTYTVTGTNANGESSSTTVTVNVLPEHTITPSGKVMICVGSSLTLTASAGTSYLWSTGETSQSITVDTAGIFTVDVDNCPANGSVQTYVAAVSPMSSSLCGGPAILTGSGPANASSFIWTGNTFFNINESNVPLINNATSFNIGSTNASIRSNTGANVNFRIDLYNPVSDAWINVYDNNTTSQFNFTGLYITFPSIATVSKIRFTSNPAQGPSSFRNFSSVPMTLSGSSSSFNYLWNTGATSQSILATAGGTYAVSIQGCPVVSATVIPLQGDTSVFGNNSWNVYAWNAGDGIYPGTSWGAFYAGFYTDDSLNFNTENRWPRLGSPSDATGYSGCTVRPNNHSWSAKRQGFTCNFYQVSIPTHDNAAQLFINGVKVWEHIGCCDVHENVWSGYLNSNSTVVFRGSEGVNFSFGSIKFIPVLQLNCPAVSVTTVNIPAGQCSATVTLDPPTANGTCSPVTFTTDHPSSTFTAGTTFVTWTGTDANGLTGVCIVTVNVLEPVAPVINCPSSVTVNSTPGICGAIVNITPTATDNCPSTSVGSKEFNYTGSIQIFPVPAGVNAISITAIGAAGGNAPGGYTGGKGASMSGFFPVTFGDTLYMLVAQQGYNSTNPNTGGGGGGGTYVSKDRLLMNGLLIAAGGGGGAGSGGSSDASTGLNGLSGGNGIVYGTAAGGSNGNGASVVTAGSGGAGWLTDGIYGDCDYGGASPRNGGAGGIGVSCGGVNGGYGGGGGSYFGAGGGGGYSGGGAGDYSNDYNFGTYGGGGGSFNAGVSQVNTTGVGTGDGKVILHYNISFPAITQTAGIPPGNIYPIGTTLNIWTVTDASGNTANCSASVSVLDKEAPSFVCPANITVNVAPGECTAIANYTTPLALDNCCPTLTGNPAYTYLGALGSHTYYLSQAAVDWNTAHTAAVSAGGNLVSVNSATENNLLSNTLGTTSVWAGGFQNHLNPTYSEPGGGWEWSDGTAFTYTNWNGGEPNNSSGEDHLQFYPDGPWNDLNQNAFLQYVVELSCNIQTEQVSGPTSGSAFPIGTTTVSFKATDAVGNTSTCSFDITVTDNANPGISVAAITGNANICVGTPSQLADATPGGTWTSSNAAVAIVDNTGLVTGVTAGSAFIKYTVNINGCDRVVYKPVNIYSVPVLTNAVISGITNVCPYVGTGIPLTYSITNAVSAVSYTWTVPTAVTILSGQGTTSITVTVNAGFVANANKQIRVKGNSQCGSSPDKIFYMLAQLPNTPQPVTGITNICSFIGTGVATSYKIPIVAGADSYIWTAPAGTTITHPNGPGAFDTIINVSFATGFITSNITVQAVNDCGTSGARTITINRVSASTPGLIKGSTNACAYILPAGTAATYYIVPVAGATSYTWTVPIGSVVTHLNGPGPNDSIITVKFPNGFTSGNIAVTATNGCGTSVARSLAINKLNPATPGIIDVIQTQTCPGRAYSYTLASMPANATSVQWTVPATAISFTGQGTSSIVVMYPDVAVQGAITATAINNCGTSTVRSTAVKLPSCPPPAFTRNGNESSQNAYVIMQKEEIISKELQVKVMPNPTEYDFNLIVSSESKASIEIQVMDISGRLIERKHAVEIGKTVNIGNNYLPGIYLAQFIQGNKRKTIKLIKL
ncbi:MAG: HYR domain-containing protein [Ferruginibacter sp.]